jgi:hypothetical protein
MRIRTKALVGAIALLGIAVPACGDDDGDDTRPARAEPKIVNNPLKQGVDYTAAIRPRLVMRFPDGGWEVLRDNEVYTAFLRTDEPGEIPDLSGTPPLAFVHPVRVYDPRRGDTLVRAPADIEAWLRDHPAVAAGRAEPVTVGGARGVRFEIRGPGEGRYLEVCGDTPCKKLFYTGGVQVFAIRPGSVIELTVLDVGGETLVIAVDPPSADKAQRVIETLSFP